MYIELEGSLCINTLFYAFDFLNSSMRHPNYNGLMSLGE